MRCKCGAKIKTTHTYEAGGGKTQRGECANMRCARVYTFVTVLVCEVQSEGDGAYALAQRLKQRRKPPKLDI